jgi:tetraacyldisaccharide 4'-kinase
VGVGNLQVGGAGKTPLVVRIAREAHERGFLTAILCRGYRGRWESEGGIIAPGDPTPLANISGDEPALLHELAPHAWIGVGADRARQYRELERRAGRSFDLVILDDGFQHWKIKKDVEVLAMTSQQPGFFLFRDSLASASRADVVVWTKGEIQPNAFGKPLVRVRYRLPVPSKVEPVWFVSGVADADAAAQSVRDSGYQVMKEVRFADHATYDRSSIETLLRDADGAGCRIALTGKDWIKWREWVAPDRVIVLEPELMFEEGRELWLEKLWGRSPSSS